MAGPTLSILIPTPITKDRLQPVRDYIDSVSSTVRCDDFWIAGCPFSFSFGDELYEEEKQINLDGWTPKAELGFAAMCNSRASHYYLAMLAHRVAELCAGRIDIGNVRRFTNNPTLPTMAGCKTICGDRFIVTPDWFCAWIANEDFRLEK